MVGHLSGNGMQQLLKKNMLGRIGCTDGKKVYIVPVTYFFNGEHIICHSLEGQKIHFMRKNPQVCFEVDEIEHPTEWKSVIISGRYEEIMGEEEQFTAMKKLTGHLNSKSRHERPVAGGARRLNSPVESTARTIVYRIFIEEMTGRFESHGLSYRHDE